MTEISHLSYTALSTLVSDCGRKYKFRYVDHLPEPLTARLVIGRVYHETIAHMYSRKLAGIEIAEEEIEEAFCTAWDRELSDKVIYDDDTGVPRLEATCIDWGDTNPGELKDRGIQMSKLYFKMMLPKYQPVMYNDRPGIELPLTKEIDGVTITGRIDAIVQPVNIMAVPQTIIVDHKWREKRMSNRESEGDYQSTFYNLLLGDTYDTEFHLALDRKEISIESVTVRRAEDEINWLRDLISEAWKQIEAGIFPPNPKSMFCSIDSCPFYTRCKIPWLF